MRAGLLALGLAAFFAVALADSAKFAPAQTTERWEADEFSAASRKRVRYYRAPVYAPYVAVPRGRYGDPSIGPDGRAYRAPAHLGSCVIDEGYGRFSACSNR